MVGVTVHVVVGSTYQVHTFLSFVGGDFFFIDFSLNFSLKKKIVWRGSGRMFGWKGC